MPSQPHESIQTLEAPTDYAARFFPTGGTIDICDNAGNVTATYWVALAVLRPDYTTKLYVCDPDAAL